MKIPYSLRKTILWGLMVESRPRIEFVDWIRGVAAFLVLFQHSFESFSPRFLSWSTHYLNFGIIGVVSFFLISGYVITHSSRDKPIGVFLINRFFRIFPLYWVMLILGLGTAIYWNKSPSLATVFANIFLIQDYTGFSSYVGGSWTLPLELAFYTLFIVLGRKSFFKNRPIALYFLASSIIVLILLRYSLEIKIPLGRLLLIHTAFQASLWYDKKQIEAKVNFLCLIGAILYYISLGENPVFDQTCLLLSWTTAYLLFFLFQKIAFQEKAAAFLSWMGKVSYSVYLGQGLVLVWMGMLNVSPAGYLFAIPITYLLAMVLYRFVEQPGLRFGKNIVKLLWAPLTSH